MNENLAFFKERWESELGAFNRVIRALPSDRLDYKPHEKNTCAGDLAWQLATEQAQLVEVIDNGQVEFKVAPTPDHDAIVAAWEHATEELRARLSSVDDARWNAPAKLVMGERTLWETTTRGLFWGYLFDMIHHRGQLSAYLRPMGGKVPSIYGPSGDDSGS